MQAGPVHEALKPLSWLIGRWKSTSAEGFYPTIKPFSYCEDLSFESLGQPFLNYTSNTWNPVSKKPIHLERGFLHIKPGTDKVAFVVAVSQGLTSLESGIASASQLLTKSKSKQIANVVFPRGSKIKGIERRYRLLDGGNLELVVLVKTPKTPLVEHLKVLYEKCE